MKNPFPAPCLLLGLAAAALAFSGPAAALGAPPEAEGWVTSRPQEAPGPVTNPGMGVTGFNTLDDGRFRDGDPPATIAYYRWYWRELEPERGRIRFGYLDGLLAQARARGQKLAFRIMAANGKVQIPEWLVRDGASGTWYRTPPDGPSRFMPDFSDPRLLENARRMILALGARYDGHPDLDHVDVGFVGHWGEWHAAEAAPAGYAWPDFSVRRQYLDWHLEAFRRTPLLMQVDDLEGLEYGVRRGTGWRADGVGDYGFHMDFYPRRLAEAGALEAWRTAPVAMETFGEFSDWLAKGVDAGAVFAYALDLHVSVFNAKSAPVPPAYRAAWEDFQSRLGYRLVLLEVRHPARIRRGRTLVLHAAWKNAGVAPPYQTLRLAYRLRSDAGPRWVWETPAEVRTWLPGGHPREERLTVPADLPAGEYALETALLPAGDEPPLALALQGRRRDGWYPVSNLRLD